MKRPLLVYDGDCGFCRRWVERWRARTGDAVAYEPYQSAAARFKDVPRERFERSVQWFGLDGRAEGAEAVFRLLATTPRGGWWLRAYRSLPGFARASRAVYELVAAHRGAASTLDRWLLGGDARPPSRRASFWLMLRLLGVVHVAAFASLWAQAVGLWGRRGILPIEEYVELARAQLGPHGWRLVPSLFWLGASDGALRAACAAGVALGSALALGYAAGPALLGLWVLYLSFVSAGREFMSFQWDILLLETTFLALWWAPWRLKPDLARWKPPAAGVWLTRLLLFRLMLESGAVKLLSGDPAWRSLSALRYHFETQPLPTWVGWYAHQLPGWSLKLACAALFAVELGAPWLILLPRRPRMLGFWSLVALQALISLTGNYCFFNLLTAVLCLSLVDDRYLGGLASRLVPPADGPPKSRWWSVPAFVVLGLLSVFQLSSFLRLAQPPPPLRPMIAALSPFDLASGYGLFAVMTTKRQEIVLEGSADGRAWKEYEFKWKPGALARRPRFAAPHQPRLDWQMWFAALGSCRENEWLLRFMARLLEGERGASALLAQDPFAGSAPPKYVRSTLYDYRFTSFGERGWWRRANAGPYCPPVSLR